MTDGVKYHSVVDEVDHQSQNLVLSQNVLTQRPQDGGVIATAAVFTETRLSVLKLTEISYGSILFVKES